MINVYKRLLLSIAAAFFSSVNAANFTESFQQLRTPGIGFQESINEMPTTTELNNCNFDDNHNNLNNAGLKSGSKYVRMMWQDFEPSDDNFQFSKLDQLIECAHQEGKSVDFRVMLSWPGRYGGKPQGLPVWLLNKGINHTNISNGSNNGSYAVPDWDNTVFLAEHAELITKLGQRYNDHKNVSSVDIGSVGFFGEWHYDIGDGDRRDDLMPSQSAMQSVVDLYYNAFPDTPKVPLEGAYAEFGFNSIIATYLKSKPDLAWRGDSWGAQEPGYPDYFNNRYNSLHNSIPDAWRTGKVVLEISGDGMHTWPGNSNISTLSDSISLAKNWHTSQVHAKHGSFPSAYIDDLIELEKKLGFRMTLRSTANASTASAGSSLNIAMTWDNVGIAPPYRDFRIAFRLRNNSNGSIVDSHISSTSIQGWLPGSTNNINAAYAIANQVPAGTYSLDTALVFHNAMDTILPIAVTQSRASDHWVPLGNVTVLTSNDSLATIQSASVPVNESTKTKIYDDNTTSPWVNDGSQGTANFSIALDATYLVSKIRYKDSKDRKMTIKVNGQVVHNNWLSFASGGYTPGGYAVINIPAPVSGSTITVETTNSSWIVARDIEIYGIKQSGSSLAAIQNVSVPVNESTKTKIYDDSSTSPWVNDGSQSTANFSVTLDSIYLVSQIRYKDSKNRNMTFKVNGQVVHNGLLSSASGGYTPGEYAVINIPTPVAGSTISVETNNNRWIVARDIEIYGTIQSGSSLATIQNVSVPVNASTKANIYDDDTNSAWENNGTQSTARFFVYLDSTYSISQIRYKDINDRKMKFKINGRVVHNTWLSSASGGYTAGGYAVINIPTPMSGAVISIETIDNPWIVVKDIEIHYE